MPSSWLAAARQPSPYAQRNLVDNRPYPTPDDVYEPVAPEGGYVPPGGDWLYPEHDDVPPYNPYTATPYAPQRYWKTAQRLFSTDDREDGKLEPLLEAVLRNINFDY